MNEYFYEYFYVKFSLKRISNTIILKVIERSNLSQNLHGLSSSYNPYKAAVCTLFHVALQPRKAKCPLGLRVNILTTQDPIKQMYTSNRNSYKVKGMACTSQSSVSSESNGFLLVTFHFICLALLLSTPKSSSAQVISQSRNNHKSHGSEVMVTCL